MGQRQAEYQIHEYANMFPAMSEAELKELADDILENGQDNPIWADPEGFILDGRHRYAACQMVDVEPVVKVFRGTEEMKLRFVVSQNLKRRHLTTSQRAMIAAQMAESFESLAKVRQESTQAKPGQQVGSHVVENLPPPNTGKSRDQAGAAFKVSGKTVDMAKKVTAKAVPEVVEAVRAGTLAVSRAAEIADMPVEEQAAAITAPREAPRRTPSLWLLLRFSEPVSLSDIAPETNLSGFLTFTSQQEAIDQGSKYYDSDELQAVPVQCLWELFQGKNPE